MIIHNAKACGQGCMWARLKEELLYNRYDTTKMKVESVKLSSGDISSAIGLTGESALPTEG